MNNRLHRLERIIESVIEDSLDRLLSLEIHPSSVAKQMVRAMNDSVRSTESGHRFAPDRYALTLIPEDAEALLEQVPDLRSQLVEGLIEIAKDSGFQFAAKPQVTLAADPTLTEREVRVIAWHSRDPRDFTQTAPREPKTEPGQIPQGAYLIVGGERHFPLDRPVVSIGRRLDNQLILDDPHVSRTHAQLRVRASRFEIYDLGSTTGTWVNNRLIKQHQLQPGDVIVIAGIEIVYREDPSGPSGDTSSYTPPFPPRPAGDQRTRTSLKRNDE
jgi:pSer/pThr/pTyr-binding forkhead associated (FHA) protein